MRYRDADHLDLGSFYARNPGGGSFYRLTGYAILVLAINYANVPTQLAWLLVIGIGAWLAAWYQVVGALWRGPLVAGILACATIRTYHLLGNVQLHGSCADGQCLMSRVLVGLF